MNCIVADLASSCHCNSARQGTQRLRGRQDVCPALQHHRADQPRERVQSGGTVDLFDWGGCGCFSDVEGV